MQSRGMLTQVVTNTRYFSGDEPLHAAPVHKPQLVGQFTPLRTAHQCTPARSPTRSLAVAFAAFAHCPPRARIASSASGTTPLACPHTARCSLGPHTHLDLPACSDRLITHAVTVLSLLLHVTSLPVRPPYIHPPVRLHCCIMCTRLQYVSRHMYPRMACTCCATLPQHDAHGCTVDPASASASAAALLRRTHSRCFFGFFGFTYVGIGQETSANAIRESI